jgi:hypothetical protein
MVIPVDGLMSGGMPIIALQIGVFKIVAKIALFLHRLGMMLRYLPLLGRNTE